MNTAKIYTAAMVLVLFGMLLITFSMGDISKQVEEDNERRSLEREQRQIQSWTEDGLELANELVYVQDSRTGICFATGVVSGWHGHFTTVDCNMVPPEMLSTTE